MGKDALEDTTGNAEQKQVLKKVMLLETTVERLLRLQSLYTDELGKRPAEIDVLSYFVEKSLDTFFKSGELEERVKQIVGG